MKKSLYIFLLISAVTVSATAQDIHFSQFFASPLTVNPANTGLFDGDYRIGANYRQQWNSVPVPYKTFAAYGDLGLMKGAFKRYYAGAGLSIASDRAGDGNLGVTKIMASGAFHYALDANRQSVVSVGLQAGWVQKRLDWSQLYFDEQWSDLEFNKSLPNGENGYRSGFGQPDVQLGVNYSYAVTKSVSLYASVAAFHLIKPKDSFYTTENDSAEGNRLGMRPVFSAGSTIKVNDKFNIYPAVYYTSQKKASEFLAGTLLSYDFLGNSSVEHNRFYLGAFVRAKDAWYPVVGYEYRNIRALFNYDVNTSELKPATGGNGAWEISIVYIGSIFKNIKPIFDVPCPRF